MSRLIVSISSQKNETVVESVVYKIAASSSPIQIY